MKNSKGVSLIALIITIIVIIILAAIVMNASTDTVGNAQYARFAQEFGEFSDQVMLDAANVKSATGIKGQIINAAQQFYMTANGFTSVGKSGDEYGIAGYTMPVGYVMTTVNGNDAQKDEHIIQKILDIGLSGDGINDTQNRSKKSLRPDAQVAYVINDGVITNYTRYGSAKAKSTGEADHEFYGDSNGAEYHFITSNGSVFTLPGFPVQQSDGSIEYHIDSKNGHYYVVKGNSTTAVKGTNVNLDVITNEQPIQAKYLSTIHGIDANGKALAAFVGTTKEDTRVK